MATHLNKVVILGKGDGRGEAVGANHGGILVGATGCVVHPELPAIPLEQLKVAKALWDVVLVDGWTMLPSGPWRTSSSLGAGKMVHPETSQ